MPQPEVLEGAEEPDLAEAVKSDVLGAAAFVELAWNAEWTEKAGKAELEAEYLQVMALFVAKEGRVLA